MDDELVFMGFRIRQNLKTRVKVMALRRRISIEKYMHEIMLQAIEKDEKLLGAFGGEKDRSVENG